MGLLEKLRQRLAEARRRREEERKAAELTAEKVERRIAAADAFLSGMLSFDPFSPPRRRRRSRRR